MLAKEGEFAAGKPTDTTTLRNKDIPVDEGEVAGELYGDLEREALAFISKASSGHYTHEVAWDSADTCFAQ